MPRMREAIRSGWKSSIMSSFSPVPTNLMGLPVDGPDGEGRAAPGVAVQLGEHDAVDAQRLVKGSGGVHRILAGHGVHHQQDLVGMDGGLDALQLVHQGLVHMEPAGGVQEDHVVAVVPGVARWHSLAMCTGSA